MLLSKKDILPQLKPMWYAGLLNILGCYINIFIYNLAGQGIVTLISATFSLCVALAAFIAIKRMTQKKLLEKLMGTTELV